MKKFMKFIPVALGLLALASCSNDDFFGESQKEDFRASLGEGDMVVSMPKMNLDGSALTRGLRDFVPGAPEITYYFTEKDEIRVYDDALTKFNIYEYRTKDTPGTDGEPLYAFRMKNTYSNIKGEPTFALYPREDIIHGDWDYVNDQGDDYHGDDNHTQGWVDVNIDDYMTYWADYSRDHDASNKEPLYQDRLPMWGKIIADGGYVESKMEYLTGILCYQLYDTSKRYKCLKVQLLDTQTKQPLEIAGKFRSVLEDNNIIRIAYEADGKTVIEKETARIAYTDKIEGEVYNNEIIVDLTTQVGLGAQDAKHLKVFVPLVCTDFDEMGHELNKRVDIVVSGSTDCKKYTELWRKENKVIKRGAYYYNPEEYNAAVDGTDICAINDVLAQLAESAPAGSELNLIAKNPIQINDKCNVIYVPNKDIKVTIDFQNGVYANKANQKLTLAYADVDNSTVPPSVELIGKLPTAVKNAQSFDLDVQLGKSAFDLVNKKAIVSGASEATCPIVATKIDATAFVFGDREACKVDDGSFLNGKKMVLSDNVKNLTVDKFAAIDYTVGDGAPYGLTVVDKSAPAGFQNAGIESITVNGAFLGFIDAHADAAPEIDLTVEGDDVYAYAIGDIRVKGKIDVLKRGFIQATKPTSSAVPSSVTSENVGVVAAHKGVNVTGQSFIKGGVFTKDNDIIINNVDFNALDLDYNQNGGGKLSDLIYELLNTDSKLADIEQLAGLKLQDIQEAAKYGYGPLYAENGNVKVTSNNSKLLINDYTNEEVASLLNQHAAKAVEFNVYALKNIDLFTENDGVILAAGGMWSEQDVNLKGNVRSENKLNSAKAKIIADRDFAMEGPSFANAVTAGHNATVSVDPQDGKCEAIYTLTFVDNPAIDGGNALFLNEGYIATVNNDTEVALKHGNKPAYAAIGSVKNPDLLIAQKDPSIWNGKQIPANYAVYYVKGSNIWTATQLAYQQEKVTTMNPIIRSHINLNNEPWKGITVNQELYTVKGTKIAAADDKSAPQKKITGINLVKNGIFTGKLAGGLTVENLWFAGKSSIPAAEDLNNVGMVAGSVGGTATLENVTIVLSGNFGSDGVDNLKAENIGGAFGLTEGPAILKGVRVNANDATLCGYAGIGGLIGKSLNDVTITNSEKYDTYGAKKGAVNGLKIKVTYKDVNAMKEYDEKQGMTGLYIGTASFLKLDDTGKPTNVGNEIRITTGDDNILEQFSLEGADETLAVKYGQVKIGDQKYTGTYSFIRRDETGKIASQTLIGQSGFGTVKQPKAVYINGQPFYVKEFLQSTPFLSGILYAVTFKGNPM